MKKKLILAAAGALSIFALAACSGGSKEIATMKGSTITVQDFYDNVKKSSDSQNTVASMIIYKVFEDKYGDKVTDKEITEEYNTYKEQVTSQGQDFKEYLTQQGYDEKSFKALIKQGLAFNKGIESKIKITDADLKAAWETFHPEVEAQIISVASEDEAKEIKKQLDEGGDFTALAKEKSTDSATKEDGGKVKFDSQSTDVPAEVSTAAFSLKDGEVSDVVTSTNASTYQSTYYLVKMVKNQSKGNDMKPYEKELKEIAKNTKLTDQTFRSKVVSDELTEANVKIKDDAFSSVLSQYIITDSSSSAEDSKTKESSSKAKESGSKESSTKESSTKESSSTEESSTTESSSTTEESSK